MEPNYEDFSALIHAEVWKRVKNGRNRDELVSDGNLAFVEASKSWKPEKGKFSTHLSWRLRYRLKPSVERKTEHLEDLKMDPPENGSGFFAAQVSGLSKEARHVVGLVFNSGVELVDMTAEHVRTTKGTIRQYLRAEGWGHALITKVFDEIKEMLT
jgi:hypothetical protein